jgi:hypothetical protein
MSFFMLSIWFITKCTIKLMFWKPEISYKMCSQNAANAISYPNFKNFLGEHSPIPPKKSRALAPPPPPPPPQYLAKFPPLVAILGKSIQVILIQIGPAILSAFKNHRNVVRFSSSIMHSHRPSSVTGSVLNRGRRPSEMISTCFHLPNWRDVIFGTWRRC